MTREERERIQKLIKAYFSDIDFDIRKTVELRDAYQLKVEKIKRLDDFHDEYKKAQILKAREELELMLAEKRDEINKNVRKVQNLIKQRDSSLDLNNQAFQSALLLIQTGGASLSYDDLTNIARTFEHDQKSLETLKSVFKNQGLTTKPLDNLLYNAENLIDSIVRTSQHAFSVDGNLNGYAQAVNRLAKFENSEIQTLVDERSYMNNMRLAAGLPISE
jgi:hypothetical protein